jgi:hypothetical protein
MCVRFMLCYLVSRLQNMCSKFAKFWFVVRKLLQNIVVKLVYED